jgi:protein required for attachment to host cells
MAKEMLVENRIPNGALILIGDGKKVLFLRNEGTAVEPNLVVQNVFANENPPTHEQGTDKPGSYSGSPGTTPRSSFEPTDWHQLGEDRFASDIAQTLYRMVHASEVDQLIVVAPPKALGVLRKAMHKEVADRVITEIPKELTAHPLPEIQRLLTEKLNS